MQFQNFFSQFSSKIVPRRRKNVAVCVRTAAFYDPWLLLIIKQNLFRKIKEKGRQTNNAHRSYQLIDRVSVTFYTTKGEMSSTDRSTGTYEIVITNILPQPKKKKRGGGVVWMYRCVKEIYKRRPRRPPFLRVESVGMGVTSSMRPILMPERAKARRAD